MINLNHLTGKDAEDILKLYEGKNPYIRFMKKKFLTEKKYFLTKNQVSYIKDFHNVEPKEVNKIVELTEYFAKQLIEDHKLTTPIKKILVETILAESDKWFHVIGKFYKKQTESKILWLPKSQLIDDPNEVEVNIEVDFEKYTKLDKRGFKLFKHQEEAVKFLLTKKGCILALDMGLGKALPIKTLVFIPNGKKMIGDLEIGDKVIGSDGKSHNVTGIYPQGIRETYNITFNDGYSVICDGEHLWQVSSPNHSINRNNKRLKKSLILTTKQMYEGGIITVKGNGINTNFNIETYYKSPNGNNKWQIPIVKPIQFENSDELPIDPYLLGLCLGDGCFSNIGVNFTLHKDDYDELLGNFNFTSHKSKESLKVGYINLKDSIEKLKLGNSRSYNKFIPDMYKYSTIENRISILQGLMDTDGHCNIGKKKCFNGTEFSTISEKLCDDVAEIVHSLGGICRKRSRKSFYKKNGVRVECNKSYRLNIKLPKGMNPFRLKRKSDSYIEPTKYPIGRYIKNIEKCGEDECVCISVDSPDKLYVIEHGIVTHNTTTSIVGAIECQAKKILVLCPSSLKINWMREIQNFTDDVTIVSGKQWSEAKFTIINYDILKNFHTIKEKDKEYQDWELRREIVNFNPDLIIIDEAHFLKNPKSIRAKILNDITQIYPINRMWLLTGTPVANRPMDYFNLLSLIKSPVASNWVQYARTYCDGKRFRKGNKFVWVTDGASNIEELAAKTKNCILRKKKEDVLDLPEKIISPVYLELKNKEGYEKVWDDYMEKRKAAGKKGNISKDLVETTLLRSFIAMETVPYTIEKTEEALEYGKKVIIFCNFNDEMDTFLKYFGDKAVCVRGGMSDSKKQLSVDKFQNDDKCMVFVGQIKAAGVGLTLTKAEIVIMNSLDWVPGNHEQAEDRCYRIGQTKTVNIYYMLIDGTIDTMVWHVLKHKKKIINTIIGDNEILNDILDDEE